MTSKEDGEILSDFHKAMCHAVIFVITDTNELFASRPAPSPAFPIMHLSLLRENDRSF